MQNDPDFSQQESLAIIQEMINKAKNSFGENGHLYLLWGWVVFVCSLAQFVLLHFMHYEKHYNVWMLTWAAFIYQVFYLVRRHRRGKVRTYTHDIIKYVWMVFAITMALMVFLCIIIIGHDSYKVIGPVFLALYGMPSFLSGIILRFKPLITGGIICWLLTLLAPFLPYDYRLLLVSVAMVAAWIVPGYLLNSKYKKDNA
ncbi:MAG: hypothetical protein QM731_17300 [Chitinophagaceae bacterium]